MLAGLLHNLKGVGDVITSSAFLGACFPLTSVVLCPQTPWDCGCAGMLLTTGIINNVLVRSCSKAL